MVPLLLYIALVSIGQTPFDVFVPMESWRELSLMCRSGRDKAINPNHLHLALVGGSRERERPDSD